MKNENQLTGADLAESLIKLDRFSMSHIAEVSGIPISKVKDLTECMGFSTARRGAEKFKKQIKGMFAKGLTDADIAEKLNLSKGHVAKYRRSLGISRPHGYRPHLKKIDDYPKTMSAAKVAKLVGCNPKTVLKCRKNGEQNHEK